jgi:hypothetical protein
LYVPMLSTRPHEELKTESGEPVPVSIGGLR